MSEINERIRHILMDASAHFIRTVSSGTALITVTDLHFSKDNKRVTLLVSVLPDTKEEVVLAFLKRKRSELRTYIKGHTRLAHIPHIDVALDAGEKHRQNIERISQENPIK